MEKTLCPLCHSLDSEELFDEVFQQSKFTVRQCARCRLAWTVAPEDEYLTNIYDREHYYGKSDNKFIPVIQNIRNRISNIRARKYLSMIPISAEKPKILDIGCAEGRLLNSFLGYGCDCFGLEHTSFPRERFINNDKITYMTGDLDSLEMGRGTFDIVVMWHVLEHMDDPARVVSIVSDLLKPNGFFIMAVPNFSSSESNTFKKFWFHIDIPWHKYHFTEKSVHQLIEKTHFKIVSKSTLCFEQGAFGICQSILNWMRWPKNELYESLKGSIIKNRGAELIVQIFILLIILGPSILITILASMDNRGSVLKYIFKNEDV